VVTAAEGERLAVLETKVDALQKDMSEIKTNVKTLVDGQIAALVALSSEKAAERTREQSRASTGVWVRTILPLLVAAVAALIGVINFISK
jgi:phage shock protein A